jgi:Arc/MetJ family transcription regulator
MSESINLTAARLQHQVPSTEIRIDDAMIAVASLMASVVTARRDTAGVPPVKGHATIRRLARMQTALVEVSGDALRVHSDLVDIGRETGGLDMHECPSVAVEGSERQAAAA